MKIKTILLLLFTFSYGYADVKIRPDAGKTSASFLKFGIGARAVGMANTFTAVADDVSAIYWNPAGLTLIGGRQAALSHNEHFQGIRHDFAGYVHPLKNGDALGVAIFGLYTEKDLEARSGGATETSWETQVSPIDYYFMTYDAAAQFSYAHKADHWLKGLSLGMSMKFIQQTIDDVSAWGAGMDIGAVYEPGLLDGLRFGATLRNLSHAGIKFVEKSYPLPFDARLGAYWKKSGKLGLALDFQQPSDNYLFISGAVEYSPVKFLSVRGGYRYRMYGLELGDITGFSAGMGFNFSRYRIDYSFTPSGVLGSSHRISLLVELPGGPARETAAVVKSAASVPAQLLPVEKTVPPAVPATVPAAPQPPVRAADALLPPEETFVFTESSASCRVIDVNLQGMVMYTFSAASEFSGVPQITGKVRQMNAERLKFEIGESSAPQKFELMEGERYYESVIFRKSFTQEISPAEVSVKISRDFLPTRTILNVFFCFAGEDGSVMREQAKKIGEDSKFLIYRARVSRLAPFAITVK